MFDIDAIVTPEKDVREWRLTKYTKFFEESSSLKIVSEQDGRNLQLIVSLQSKLLFVTVDNEMLEDLPIEGPMRPTCCYRNGNIFFYGHRNVSGTETRFRIKLAPSSTRSDYDQRDDCLSFLSHYVNMTEKEDVCMKTKFALTSSLPKSVIVETKSDSSHTENVAKLFKACMKDEQFRKVYEECGPFIDFLIDHREKEKKKNRTNVNRNN